MKNIGPNRSFGLILAAGCTIVATLSYRAGHDDEFVWSCCAAFFLLVALAMPRALAPARRGWLKLGLLFGTIINPLILGFIFAVIYIPVGGLIRLFRRDTMERRRDPVAASYWIERAAGTSSIADLKEQF